jgi:hypothetical protein
MSIQGIIVPCKETWTERLKDADENGREIHVAMLTGCRITGRNMCYPNCLLWDGSRLVSPYDEQVMSLKKESFYDEGTFDVTELVGACCAPTIQTPMFFFVYNFDNYYHFLYDTIPYLHTYFELKEREPDLKLLVGLPNVGKKELYRFNVELLELLGVWGDVHFCRPDETYARVYVSSSLTHGGRSNAPPRKELYELYSKLTSKVVSNDARIRPYPSKIYISRRTWIHNDVSNIGTNYTTRRRFVNEDALVEHLMRHGFEEVFTENMTMREKICMFHRASHVVGCIGGGMCNLLFSKPDTRATCIVSPFFLDINRRFGFSMDHTRIRYVHDTRVAGAPDRLPLYIRVRLRGSGLIGEVVGYSEEGSRLLYVVQMSQNDVAGFNSEMQFEKKEVGREEFEPLDMGLNSPFILVNEELGV